MSYSYAKTATGGVYKSHVLQGREFPYTHDRNGVNKRQALADMRAVEKQHRDAALVRPPAPKSDHVSRVVNTTHEDKAANVRHLSSSPNWATETPDDRLQKLTRDLAGAKSQSEVARIHRRIAAHTTAQDRGQAKAAAREAAEANRNSPELKAALEDARATLDSLSQRSDISQSYIDSARANLNNLIVSANVGEYSEASKLLQSRYAFEQASRVANASAEVNSMRRDIRGMKADTLLPTEETEGSTDANN